jgi:glutaminase
MVSQQNPNACQMHEADVVFNAIAQQPAVQAFNLLSALVTSQRPTVLRFRSGAIATMWSDHLDATLS